MAQPLILPKWKFFDAAGLPLAGGKLYSYAAGTTTPLATYTDTTEGTPNTNPLILDANGEGVIWIGSLSYKFILKDSLDNVLWTADGIQSIPNGSITTVKLADGSVTTIKIADDAVTTAKILDANVTTAKIADNAVTTAKIPDGAITFAKLTASTEIAFVDTTAPRYGAGPVAFPKKPWSAPTLVGNPASPVVGDGLCVAWSPNGKLLAVAESNTDYVAIFSRFGTELVKLSAGLTSPPSTPGNVVAWSPDSQYLITSGPAITTAVFQRCGNAFGLVLTPARALAGTVNAAAWCPNNDYFAIAHDLTPFISIFKRTDVLQNHVIARYGSNNAQSIAASTTQIVNYETIINDNTSAVTIGASWKFVAPRSNSYRIQARATFGSTYSISVANLEAYRNSALWTYLDMLSRPAGALTQPDSLGGSDGGLVLSAGEELQVRIFQNTGGATLLAADIAENYISIVEDAGYESLSTFSTLSNPSTLPTGNAKSVAWSPDGQFLAVGHANLNYSFIVTAANATVGATYTNNGVTFTVTGTISGATLLLATGASAPTASGTLTKTSGTGDSTITFSSVATPVFLTIYQRTGDTFAKCADPAALPVAQVNGLAWSPDGLKLTCVHGTSPFITSYTRSGATFTKIVANPNVLPAGAGNGCAYNYSGDKLAVAHDTTPFVTIYSVSGSTFTKDTDPASLPTGNGKSVSWTPDGQFLTVGHVSSPYVTTYQTSGVYGSNAVTYVKGVDLV